MVALDDKAAFCVAFDLGIERFEAVRLAWGIAGGQYEPFGAYRHCLACAAMP